MMPVRMRRCRTTSGSSSCSSDDSQIALIMNTYSHVLPELQREAAARMEELISRT